MPTPDGELVGPASAIRLNAGQGEPSSAPEWLVEFEVDAIVPD